MDKLKILMAVGMLALLVTASVVVNGSGMSMPAAQQPAMAMDGSMSHDMTTNAATRKVMLRGLGMA